MTIRTPEKEAAIAAAIAHTERCFALRTVRAEIGRIRASLALVSLLLLTLEGK
jgi:hypothetical protein